MWKDSPDVSYTLHRKGKEVARIANQGVLLGGDEYFVDIDETDDTVLLLATVVCLDLLNETWPT